MTDEVYDVNSTGEGAADLRFRLIAAALTALDRGEEVGLRALARSVGVSAMAPYRHFSDKSALLGAVATHGFDLLKRVLHEADRDADARVALLAQGEAYLRFARRHKTLFRLMFAGHVGEPPPADDTAYGLMVRRVEQLAPADLQAATLACWSAVHGMATLGLDQCVSPETSPVERAALALVIAGLAARP